MGIQLPGSDILGFGFNALGSYSTASVTQQVFSHQNNAARQFRYAPTDLTYDVPDNLSVFEETTSGGSCQIFSSEEQFQGYFAAKADVRASVCGFKGQFKMAYSNSQETQKAVSYGLYEMNYTAWRIVLTEQGVTKQSETFANDPDVQRLPEVFNAANAAIFFRVLDRFGTHFVSEVVVGGSLHYYVAIEESYSRDQEALQASLSLEYEGLFSSAKADSEVAWGKLSTSWSKSHWARIAATGGDSSPLNSLSPSANQYFGQQFASWVSSVMTNPMIIDFKLRPLSVLFGGKVGSAMDAAIQAYLNNGIVVETTCDFLPVPPTPGASQYNVFANLLVGGAVLQPSATSGSPVSQLGLPAGGLHVAILSADGLQPLLNKLYYNSGAYPPNVFEVYERVMADVGALTAQRYYVAIATFGIPVWGYPSDDFVRWVRSCGGTLAAWHQLITWTGTPYLSGYVLAGQQGLSEGQATEGFASTADDTKGFDLSEVLLLNRPSQQGLQLLLHGAAR